MKPSRLLFFLSLFPFPFFLFPSGLLHGQDWPVLKNYDQQHLFQVALPIGGIGTGTVSLGGRGELRDWEIMNRPGKGFSTLTKGNGAPFFAIFIQEGDQTCSKGLLGPLYDVEYQDKEGRPVNNHGLPRFGSASFSTAYPFGIVHLSDSRLPVSVDIKGFNPLIPANADDSGIPMAVLYYEVTNNSSQEVIVSIAGTVRNFIGRDGGESIEDWKGDDLFTGARDNKNLYRRDNSCQGIFFYSDGVARDHPAWGTMSLTTTETEGISYRLSSVPNDWENALLDFWDDFSSDGELTDPGKLYDQDPMASLAVKKTILPGQTMRFPFYLTWHFPNRKSWSQTIVGNYYTTRYADAWDVAAKEIPRIPRLEELTLLFVRSFLSSHYPDVIKEAALFNLSTLRSQTVFRLPSGHMMGWEGVMDKNGSCYGSCTHVWNYEQATGFLFGDLSRSMRDIEFGMATNDTGRMSFRVGLPLSEKVAGQAVAADGQMGTIMRFYRDWQLSGDRSFLVKYWPRVKAAMSFAWRPGSWDPNRDGVMEGSQHNTMDVNYFGPNPQMQFWYFGALKASEQMALAMGDRSFARDCARIYSSGSRWYDEHLFNGEYYEHQVLNPDNGQPVDDILSPDMPPYQLAEGCLIDQLVGQYMAHICGLGYLAPQDHIRITLQSILKYNNRASMMDHFNNMRSYALAEESALLMAAWPKGRPKVPFPYFNEVMTGFEYAAAIGMLYEGMEREGLQVVQHIRDRYDGAKRNPFDEAECGHHYARAMASWGTVVAWSGFRYSGVDRILEFKARPGKFFWSNGTAWGLAEINQELTNLKISVLYGQLEIERAGLSNCSYQSFRKPVIIDPGHPLTCLLKRN